MEIPKYGKKKTSQIWIWSAHLGPWTNRAWSSSADTSHPPGAPGPAGPRTRPGCPPPRARPRSPRTRPPNTWSRGRPVGRQKVALPGEKWGISYDFPEKLGVSLGKMMIFLQKISKDEGLSEFEDFYGMFGWFLDEVVVNELRITLGLGEVEDNWKIFFSSWFIIRTRS